MPEYQYLDATGVVLPDTSETLSTVEAEYRDALGQELITDPATPQGRLIATEVSARDNMLRNNAALANQINPDIAGGVFLDAIWALTGGQRIAATQSVARGVALAGTPRTVIPGGSQARTSAGNLWETLSEATLDSAGNAYVDMRAIDFGPQPAPEGAINIVVSGVLGWETVTNPTAAELGQKQESDVASRTRRKLTLALQGVALPEAAVSALHDTPGVRSLAYRENVADVPTMIDGVLLAAHSMYAVVEGGSDADVARAILSVKSIGCDYNGATSVAVLEPASGQTYTVRFDRPTLVPIKARASIRVQGAIADPAATVRAALIAYAAGEIDGETGLVVGQSVSPFEFSGAVNALSPGIYVQKMEIALTANALAVAEVPITIQQLATLNVNNIEVVIL